MRPSRKSTDRAGKADPTGPEPLSTVIGGTELQIAYRMGYVLNFYREPSFRRIEMELGLTRPEIVTLIFLNFREGVTASEICEFSGHLKANISRGIIALEKKKLIRRAADKTDSRRQQLFMTAAGRALYAKYIPALRERERAMLACLTRSERSEFERLLDKLAAHVPQWAALDEL
ncbi:MarR family winged helix-turn-helix transcriptional regulator [Bradyrhizobium sp. CCGB20]|uniref:MarR family winged helix-turn-helix transcriptional regulator n=1 Tax=Bradyrhizobium sp. CCGB20 TaxID=2949633 RepID=UPI0020B1E391|nr:MarR family winged helix-turn-helix transcriptional regulator [Bradyrhizobium sp. CCGB20]MCP3397302.1 MarR family winged helix-turn-helix transcriptional regulator [Bradyrhizobium sp. CCGB20]